MLLCSCYFSLIVWAAGPVPKSDCPEQGLIRDATFAMMDPSVVQVDFLECSDRFIDNRNGLLSK